MEETKCDNGTSILFEETKLYFKLTIGKKTWYWRKDNGEYDGCSIFMR